MSNMNYPHSFEPVKIGGITLKNRYAIAPMGANFGQLNPHGEYSDNFIEYLTERARGGFGLITLGSAQCETTVNGAHPYDDAQTPLRAPKTFRYGAIKLTDRIHKYGAKIFFQDSVGHGRMRGSQKSASEIPYLYSPEQMTQPMTKDEIQLKIDSAVKLAVLAKSAGFDGIEIHGMHWGYLLDQFASPNMNHRDDEYGGDLDGRLNFVRKLIVGIKEACGKDYPVSIRFTIKHYMAEYGKASLTGDQEFGRSLEQAVEIVKKLESYGIDMFNCNSGSYDGFYYACPPYYMDYCYNLALGKAIKEAVSVPVFLAGKMDDPVLCEEAIANGDIDGIVLGRASLADPHYPQKLQMNRKDLIRPCISCHNCSATLFDGGMPMCAVNPAAFLEETYDLRRSPVNKNVVIIGGGVAGMEAARVAAICGHKVSLYERSDELGGHLKEAGSHAFKRGIANLNHWYQKQIEALGVDIHLNSELKAQDVIDMNPDAAVLAIGSEHFVPHIPGYDSQKASVCQDILLGKKKAGKHIVIVGGGLTGCELAYELAAYEKKDVTLVEGLDNILSSGVKVPQAVDNMLRDLLDHYKVKILTGNKISEVTETGAVVADHAGKETIIPADNVIFAIGLRPNKSFADELYGNGIEVYELGDGSGIGNIRTAIAGAYEVMRRV